MFDLLIQQALIVDGSGAPGYTGDLAVKDGKIAAVEPVIQAQARQCIQAGGQVLCPGFIDPHSHWDATHLESAHAQVKLRQGVCLDLVGNCGESLAPCWASSQNDLCQQFPDAAHLIRERDFTRYTEELNQAHPGVRVMSHVGHGTLRILAMGQQDGPPHPAQLERMKNELALALEQGAAGLSTGLYYTPSGYAGREELEALMTVVAQKERFHASHIRNEAEGIFQALEEVIEVGLATGASTHVSHLKLAGRENWRQTDRVIEVFEKARAKGLDLTCDVYPYDRSCTTILSLVPPWSREGGADALVERLKDARQRQCIREHIIHGAPGWESNVKNAGFDGIVISSVHSGQRPDIEGQTIARIADDAAQAPEDVALDLIQEECGAVSIICASMNEADVAEFIKLPFAMIGSDGFLSRGKPHPRAYGAFPRVIRRFVRELKVLSLEEAIAKMTGITAKRLKRDDCGLLRKGRRADLVLFDPDRFGDQATFEKPRQFATGLTRVIMEGQPVWTAEGEGSLEPVKGGFVAAP